jgi:hypothetical protein
MDATAAGVLIVIVFALIIIAGFVVYPRIRANIKGPLGTGLEINGTPNETPPNQAAIKAEDVTSHKGGLLADDRTGRGVDVSRVEVEDDVLLSSAPPQAPTNPKADPPA